MDDQLPDQVRAMWQNSPEAQHNAVGSDKNEKWDF